MSAVDFGTLPDEYVHLLHLAKEQHGLNVVPLQALSGGRTGAFLYLVSVSRQNSQQVEHFILKLDQFDARSKQTEIERHRQAVRQAPAVFGREHMARLAYEVQHEGAAALFYTVAGQSLQRFDTLAANDRQSRLEALFGATNDYFLREWNAEAGFERAQHPQELLGRWLGYRLGPKGRIGSFIADSLLLHPDTEGFLVQGQVFPNPLFFARSQVPWKAARPIDVLTGFQHGDLNIGNILAAFADASDDVDGYFVIDFALYKSDMPLLYDQRYLEMSFLNRELDRASLEKWIALVTFSSTRDLPDPRGVPVELAGACAVINAGRASFERWIRDRHPSLSDDLWGQCWLAAVAAGLNFCNKDMLGTEARLAGLIYSAIHLKRYCVQFGIPMPEEARLLYDASKWTGVGTPSGSLPPSGPKVGAVSTGSGLPAGSPVTRERDARARSGNLPVHPTPFVGREVELMTLRERLAGDNLRLVTLTGPGGTGKTRLALEAAWNLIDHYPDGVFVVDLAPIRDPEAVPAAIARVLDLRETSDSPLIAALKARLRTAEMLLVLDNFEQVTAAAPRIAELLQACPGVNMIVTSREALHVRGEQIFPVPPLSLPEVNLTGKSIEELGRYEGIQLFVARAQAVKPDFELTDDNVGDVAELCSRLDGLPLAIELATARLNLFTPRALTKRVGSPLKLLRGGARDLPARQKTLRDTIDWSYQLLQSGEKQLFALLSLFVGCTLEDVEAVAGDVVGLEEVDDILEGVTSLVDKSLIRPVTGASGESRFLMLETLREYAEERLVEDEVVSASARRAHATYFANLTQYHFQRLNGPEREEALRELESNLENVQSAWRYWSAKADLQHLHKLTDGLWMLYDARGWYSAMVDLASDILQVLSSAPSTPDRVEQEILMQISLARALMTVEGCTPQVEDAYTRALELCNKAGEVPQLHPVLRGLASFYLYVADLDRACAMGRQILDLAERRNDRQMMVEGHLVCGYSLGFSSDLQIGLDHLDQAIRRYDPEVHGSGLFRFGTDPGVACHMTRALILWMQGFPDKALGGSQSALALSGKLDHPYSKAYCLFHAGLLHVWRREAGLVRDHADAALEVAEAHDFQIWQALATCLRGIALSGLGQTEEGLKETNRGIAWYQGLHTPPIFWPLLLMIRAEVSGNAGRAMEGLSLLDEALRIVGEGPEFVLSAEILRLKGDLMLSRSSGSRTEVEALYERAAANARHRNATMLELRATIGLCRLWRDRGKVEEGRGLLGGVYEKMTEGYAIHDLADAKALLEELTGS